ncbi:hypothetical protein P170DRAFT_508927 [Aspergillus steynii IBT 23096]|uniref:Zn(2)-C6 fungal-type domain-containing protein n=1 Tax=Aspergillus steynii IBT 23096 TaxID=1392250 RepID=A0A2I2GD39_9EURO|nr:uncharacterized protein P170DRAFT_508927 [Aspergillus steynii IBT 23096]PLB50816.1 hypothetical protein P170DRAFT_508927 [Aspergillus steynii IBT 23096]
MNSSAAQRSECPRCGTKFGHRSSLVRHLRRNCNEPQANTIRRKSCSQCASDKTRCSLQRPNCSRCTSRGLACQYPTPSSDAAPASNEIPQAPVLDGHFDGLHMLSHAPLAQVGEVEPLSDSIFSNLDDIDFNNLGSLPWSLRRVEDAGTGIVISDDQMNQNLATPELISAPLTPGLEAAQTPETASEALVNHSMEIIFRVVRTWPKMLAEEFQLPPLVHPTQVSPNKTAQPLAHCITLSKMWHGQCKGAEQMVYSTILRELTNLLDDFRDYDEETLLAALQAVVIYTIILLFPSKDALWKLPEDSTIFFQTQRLVYHVVSTGLFLQEEREQKQPSFYAWLHVTSKRRAVLSLYLLQWAYSVFHGTSSFDCKELGFMPAPAAKILWEAHDEHAWNTRYIRWLARWGGQGYLQGEFDKIKRGIVMEARAEKWLEETDEFGFIMISIVNATDYHPPLFGALVC